ncbi:MAG: 5-histidylcysteine sulfoxide synthase [Candidatus Cloacimonetes bacterium]|nr:5-histidylcysteine sulfoxide synthase [Candidatus Cloacimonadota bacterium]
MKDHIARTIILSEGNASDKRAEIRQYFHKTWEIDDQLYTAIVNENTLYKRADPLRHPLIFYIGHTAVFYINKLILAKVITQRINPEFESMFAVGVDEMSWDDLNEANYNWSSLSEVMSYRKQVRDLIDKLITELDLVLPVTWHSPFWIIMMGIEHQRIHLETSSMLIRQLPLEDLQDNELSQICRQDNTPPVNKLIAVTGRTVKLGKSQQHPLYGWDNEYGTHEYDVADFQAAKYLVSNQEFLEFVQSGGYQEPGWWTEEGWNWREYTQAEHPKFWVMRFDKWYLRLVTSEIPLPWSFPVEINYLEAKAFCNWKTAQTGLPVRLPTEEEWYILYDDHVPLDQPWWKTAPGNINLEHYDSPCPVDIFQFGEFYDIIGNVWQWTETPMNGFQGFKVHPCYDDFSTPTFDGRHNLIKGGSWISTGNEATRDSRYAFRRHFFQHAGFRYVISQQPVPAFNDFYEDDLEITPYCELDYGKDILQFGNFSHNLAALCQPYINNTAKALNIGCGTGRTAFELAKFCEKVIGVDFTARLIKVAEKMKTQQKIKYLLPEEGEILSFQEANLADLNLQDVAHKTEFWQADASNLGAKFKDYDFILAQNIFEKIYDPMNFLNIIAQRLNQNGILIISSTYNWSEKFTSKEKQLGGFRQDGEPIFSLDTLHQLLQDNFTELQSPRDCPFLLRINNRTYTYSIAQVTFWQKR